MLHHLDLQHIHNIPSVHDDKYMYIHVILLSTGTYNSIKYSLYQEPIGTALCVEYSGYGQS